MPFDSEITTKSRDQIMLEKARDRIVSEWPKNVCIDTSFCGLDDDKARARFGVPKRIMRLLGFDVDVEMWRWNDDPARKLREVLARFDAAISRMES